jgi:hypothetical protein
MARSANFGLDVAAEMASWKPKMDTDSADPQYGKEFTFTLVVVILTLVSAIFLSAAWLTLLGYWAWAVLHWIAA